MELRETLAGALLLIAAALSSVSPAQGYPTRPIRLIVPFTPGTAADTWARLLGPYLSQRLSVPVVVDNRSGASGIIGIESAAQANPDGHTFLFAATAFGTLAAMNPKLPYDPGRSFAPVIHLGTSPLTLVVANRFPGVTVRALVDEARKQPGMFNYASSGTGSVFHLTMEWFKQEAGVNLVHVPYKGTAGVVTDLIAGNVQASMMVLQTVAPHAQGGRVRLLAVLGKSRAQQFAQVPTLAESGFPGMIVDAWVGVMAPAKTPRAAIAKLNGELNALIALPEIRETLEKAGINITGGAPEALDTLVQREIRQWRQVVRRADIRTE